MIRTGFVIGGLLAGVLLLAVPALASSDFSATFGTQWWSQTAPEAKFQEFRDLNQGAYLETYMLRSWKGRELWGVQGTNAMRHDQSISGSYWNGVRFHVDVDYSEIPHNFSFTARTPYHKASPGVLTLPDSLQQLNQNNAGAYTSTMTDLLANAARVPLGFRTDLLRGRARIRPAAGWQVEAKLTRRLRSGTKPYGAAFGFNSAIEVTEPINQQMVDGDARLSYQKQVSKKVGVAVQGSFGFSTFQNDVDALRWDNPKRITDRTYASAYVAGDGSVQGQLDLYPDNRVVRGSLAGALKLPYRTAATATIGISQNTQSDRWLPYTVNTAILQPDSFPLPGSNTDAKAMVYTQDYRVTSHPIAHLGGTLRLHDYFYRDQTPEHDFAGQVRLDQVWEAVPATSEAHTNRNQVLGADADYDPVRQISVGGSVERESRYVPIREAQRTTDKSANVRTTLRPTDRVELKASYRYGNRKLEEFDPEAYINERSGLLEEQPSLRRFDLADRKQHQGKIGLTWMPSERMNLRASFEYILNAYYGDTLAGNDTENEFRRNVMGLVWDKQQRVSLEGDWRATPRLSLDGGYGWGQTASEQRSRQSGATIDLTDVANWTARLKDWNIYTYGGFDWQARPQKISFNGRIEYERAPGIYHLSGAGGTAMDLPGTRYRRTGVTLDGLYQIDPGLSVGVRYGWEQFDVIDFAATGIPLLSPVTGTSNAIYLGDNLQDYRANILALVVKKTF